jgi:hypothetical protein
MAGSQSERTVLYACLTAATLAAAGGLAAVSWAPRASTAVIAAVVAVIVVSSAVLRRLRDGIGGEGRFVDLWSIPHFLIGVALALCGVDLLPLVVLVSVWELIEIACRVFEYPSNRVVDIVLAIAGWGAVRLW